MVPRSQQVQGRRLALVCIEVCFQRGSGSSAGSSQLLDTPPVAVSILKATCDCTKGQAGCAHKSAAVHTACNIPRENHVRWSVPCTSKECNWNKPAGQRWKYSEKLPIEKLPLRKQERVVSSRPYSERRPSTVHGGFSRANWHVRPPHIRESIQSIHNPRVAEPFAAFLDGCPCINISYWLSTPRQYTVCPLSIYGLNMVTDQCDGKQRIMKYSQTSTQHRGRQATRQVCFSAAVFMVIFSAVSSEAVKQGRCG
eukprot:1728593-Pleurochrysis_carterae.AAC.3